MNFWNGLLLMLIAWTVLGASGVLMSLFGGDGHPTSGKREDEHIGLAAVGGELGSEEFAGVLAIAEHTGLDAVDQAWGLPVINKEWSVMSSRKLISMRMETML